MDESAEKIASRPVDAHFTHITCNSSPGRMCRGNERSTSANPTVVTRPSKTSKAPFRHQKKKHTYDACATKRHHGSPRAALPVYTTSSPPHKSEIAAGTWGQHEFLFKPGQASAFFKGKTFDSKKEHPHEAVLTGPL